MNRKEGGERGTANYRRNVYAFGENRMEPRPLDLLLRHLHGAGGKGEMCMKRVRKVYGTWSKGAGKVEQRCSKSGEGEHGAIGDECTRGCAGAAKRKHKGHS